MQGVIFIASGNARRSSFLWLARHRSVRGRKAGRDGTAPGVPLPRGARHEHARLDARPGLSTLAAGEPSPVPDVRIARLRVADHDPARDADRARRGTAVKASTAVRVSGRPLAYLKPSLSRAPGSPLPVPGFSPTNSRNASFHAALAARWYRPLRQSRSCSTEPDTAAEAWLNLASVLGRPEATLSQIQPEREEQAT
jgi:hypothetical protein